MAKFNAEMLSKCVAWVEKNGLYPQPGGAPIKQFCEAMTIDPKTYREWMKNPSPVSLKSADATTGAPCPSTKCF